MVPFWKAVGFVNNPSTPERGLIENDFIQFPGTKMLKCPLLDASADAARIPWRVLDLLREG